MLSGRFSMTTLGPSASRAAGTAAAVAYGRATPAERERATRRPAHNADRTILAMLCPRSCQRSKDGMFLTQRLGLKTYTTS